MNHYLTIDVGGTSIKYALMNEDAIIEEQGEVPTPKSSMDEFIESIGGIYDQYADHVEAIAMSAPGRIDATTGYFYTSGALRYIGERDMSEVIAKRCRHIPFGVENDAKSAALAELWKGSMQGVTNGIVLALGTGIGGALIMDGKLHRGSNFAAGEVSCIPTEWCNDPDPRTQWATLESTSGLVKRYALKKNESPENLNGRIFFENANLGEAEALEVLDEYCLGLATGIFGLQLILDVEKVAIGGGISKQPLLIETINKKVDEVWRAAGPNPALRPEIVACKFGNDANLIGALYHYLFELK